MIRVFCFRTVCQFPGHKPDYKIRYGNIAYIQHSVYAEYRTAPVAGNVYSDFQSFAYRNTTYNNEKKFPEAVLAPDTCFAYFFLFYRSYNEYA